MAARRVFITGANGFVGRHLIAHLLELYGSGIEVSAAVRPEEADDPGILPSAAGWSGRPEANISLVPFDVSNAAQVSGAIEHARPDWIVHLAARASGADNDRDAIMAVNVEGARNVLEAAGNLSPFPRTLVVSTGYVYGNTNPTRPAREEDPVGPLWRLGPYTDSKIEMESVARNYRAFAVIARPFSHTGPGQAPIFAVPAFARQLARIEAGIDPPILKVGNLTAKRDLLDVRDVVRAYVGILNEGRPGEVYNVALGAPIEIREVLDRLRVLCSAATEIEIDPARLRPADISCSSGDPLRLWTTTNWNPRIPLDSTLTDTLDYWRAAVAVESGRLT